VLPCITDETARTPRLAARLRSELARVESQIESLLRTREILAGLVEEYTTSPDHARDSADHRPADASTMS
jgi:hypothetical protein